MRFANIFLDDVVTNFVVVASAFVQGLAAEGG